MSLRIALPPDYDFMHLRSFYGRDPEPTGETIEAQTIRKNILHRGAPLQLALWVDNGYLHAHQQGKLPMHDAQFELLVTHLAGLQQNTADFRQQFGNHPDIGVLIQQAPSLFVPQLMPFEALSWAIIGQLISVAAATTIRRRFILLGEQEHLGLWAYPDASTTLELGFDKLRGIGFSATKARALLAAAEAQLQDPRFLPSSLAHDTASELSQRLQKIPGIGPWTAQYTLLRGYNHLAGDMSSDLAVRRGLGALTTGALTAREAPTAIQTRQWLEQFAPYQALVAAHLWHWQSQHF